MMFYDGEPTFSFDNDTYKKEFKINMNITILSKNIETKPTAKGSYQVADVAYKNNTFQGKVEGKKVMSFGASAQAFKVLAIAQPGETYEVTIVKNDKGYNDWTNLQKVDGAAAPQQQAAPAASKPGSVANASPRSTYETPEERAAKQVYIVRQSSIASAIAALSVGSKTAVKKEDVLTLAKDFESYVFGKAVADGGATGFDDIPDLDPAFGNPVVD
jgi:hypothetical protein